MPPQDSPREGSAVSVDYLPERWWIATDRLDQPHKKILGPFESRDLAMRVRGYVEQVEHRSFWVDREGRSFYASEPAHNASHDDPKESDG